MISSQPAVAADLASVEYSVRWVLGLFYPQAGMVDTAWAAQYLASHPVLRFIAVDNVKRGRPDLPSSVLLHSSVRYALDNKDANPDTVKAEMLSSLQQLHPAWPEPEFVKTLRWLYSQVETTHSPLLHSEVPHHTVLGRYTHLTLGGPGRWCWPPTSSSPAMPSLPPTWTAAWNPLTPWRR